ncbi:MAG: hypothetical protein AB7N91_02105 [Candidatus Tectimicrobiota bacterium]
MVPNLERMAQQLQQRAVALRRWRLGLDVLLVALAAALCLPWLAPVLFGPLARVALYGSIVLSALVVFVILAWRIRANGAEVLAQADRTLGLHETLSTAYEYQQHHADNPFLPGLLDAAARLLPRVHPHQVLPRRLPRRLWAIPLLLLAIIGSSLLPLSPLPFDDLAAPEVVRDLSREGQRLEQWGRELEELAKREQLDRSRVLARQMQQLGQRLQRESTERMQAAERISSLSQYLQRLQQELHERALMSEAAGAAAQDVLASTRNVKQELRDILHLLQNDTAPREMAAAAEQSVLRLGRQVGHNAQLEQLLNTLRTGDLQAARQLLQDVLQQQQAVEEGEQLDRARRALEYASRAIQRSPSADASHPRPRTPQNAPAPQDGGEAGDEGLYPEDMSGMDDAPGPGSEASHGTSVFNRPTEAHDMRESEQPPSKVEVKSGEGARHLSYVRALPLQNDAQVPFEQAVVHYQHAAEAVLAQEQMPRGYREQIKQYFLSLGMVK